MAEARSIAALGGEFTAGTRVGTTIDEEGLHIRTVITIPRPRECGRRLRHWLSGLYRQFVYTFLPFGPAVVIGFVALVVGIVVQSPRDSWVRSGPVATFVWDVGLLMPWIPGISLAVRVGILAAWVSILALLITALVQRWALKLLLRNKAYLYSARAPTIGVKIWFMLVRCLTHRKPLTYSFQSSLPALPVPRLKDTVDRYLEYAEVLCGQTGDAAALETIKKQAADFLANEGPRLQWYLNLKSWISPNYVTDWWEKYVYLRGRSSIAINSNYYVLDSGRWTPSHVPEARAAVVLYSMMAYKERLEAERIEPTMIGEGAVPLCMWQYERMFATSRIPGRECDEIKHWESTGVKHVAVWCKGTYYKLNVYDRDGSLRTPDDLETAFAEIRRDSEDRHKRGLVTEATSCIAALTGENRTRWAEIRETYLMEGSTNRRSLHEIESALMHVVLSDATFALEDWTKRGHYLIGSDRSTPNVWFDKSVTMVVFTDGKTGLNCEHAWADAPVCGHLFEVSMIAGEDRVMEGGPYKEDGHCRPWPKRNGGCATTRSGSEDSWHALPWLLPRACEDAVLQARTHLQSLIDDLDLCVSAHTAYGKAFVKKCRVSPDAYVQMAMQLAYYRDQGRLDATYESSMTRLYLHGRTETVRPCTSEAAAFVRTMEDPLASGADKLAALQKAASRHVRGYTDAMAGKGIDRHLFALYVVSVGKEIDSPFLKGALSVPWKLSTSQQPQQQTTLWDIRDPANARRISPGGGFGPVVDDGYGVSYMVSGEQELFFHVSSKRSCAKTDSTRFRDQIFRALADMKAVLAPVIAAQEAKGKGGAAAAAAVVPAPVPAPAPAAEVPAKPEESNGHVAQAGGASAGAAVEEKKQGKAKGKGKQ